MKHSKEGRPNHRLDNRPPGPDAKPVTLADFKEEGRLVWVYCLNCCLERDVEPDTIPLPLDRPVPSVGKRLKCRKCGGRLQAKPQLYELPIAEMRAGRSFRRP